MKARVPSHKKNGRYSFFCVLFLLGVLVSALCLGSIRIYGLYLEHRLAECAMKIESTGDEYAMLEEAHAALLSPSRIYNYAKSELNMVAASGTETIKLLSDSYDWKKENNTAKGGDVARGPGGLSRIFVGTANAKE
jgi:cell division protein FtsL